MVGADREGEVYRSYPWILTKIFLAVVTGQTGMGMGMGERALVTGRAMMGCTGNRIRPNFLNLLNFAKFPQLGINWPG